MTSEASGPAKEIVLSAEVGWHTEQQQPMVVLRLNDGGCAITPEAAMRFAVRVIMAASASVTEAGVRSYLIGANFSPADVDKAMEGLRTRLNMRAQVNTMVAQEHQEPERVFLHQIRVDTTGDPQLSFHMVKCQDCDAEPGQACRR